MTQSKFPNINFRSNAANITFHSHKSNYELLATMGNNVLVSCALENSFIIPFAFVLSFTRGNYATRLLGRGAFPLLRHLVAHTHPPPFSEFSKRGALDNADRYLTALQLCLPPFVVAATVARCHR